MSLFAPSPSSGSSSVEYEVFISFRGSDTRYAFTSHLHAALIQRKIVTFIDYEIPSGNGISSALLDAIKKSKAAVVIFSEHYASSTWCLDELVEILKWNKIVIPVFYHVNPTDVEEQTGSYAASFAIHKTNGIPVETLQNWKKALKDASYHKGYVTADIRDEASLTKRIVDDIWKELRTTYKIDNNNLVGIEPKVDKIESLLNMGSGDVFVVGIWGIGGIGKTTLAIALFNKIRIQYEGSCFLRNIREESEKDVERLRQRLYFDMSGGESGKIVDNVTLNFLLSRKKVLIVFDDVTDAEQIKNIVQDVNWYNKESRFIITSRNKQVLRNCDCKEENIYEVKGLCDQDANQLFSRFASKQEHPQEDYTDLARKMVAYAKGSLLALEVLGSHICSKSQHVWESAIEKLERALDQKIQGVLKVSFDELDNEQKDVFLDVACFFKGKRGKDIANLYNYNIECTLSTLIDRCLVSVDSYGHVTMHDLLQEMGWQIVLKESIENPGGRSRLWNPDDIYQVLTRNEGTRAIKAISFDTSKTRAMHLSKNSFINMSELWFLNIYSSDGFIKSSSLGKILSCSEDFQCVSTKLRFLRWDYYPMKSLQSSFSLENLVILRMQFSKVEQLWNGVQPPPNLKEIDLSECQNLTTIPDLSLVPKLETISLSGCDNLTSLPPCDLPNLKEINLSCCQNLTTIPDLSLVPKLERISLSGCPNLTSLPPCDLPNLKQIFLSCCRNLTTIADLSLGPKLEEISFSFCDNLISLPRFDHLKSLRKLKIWSCDKLVAIPELYLRDTRPFPNSKEMVDGSLVPELEEIYLSCDNLTTLPPCDDLKSLRKLDLSYCENLVTIPKLSCNISRLDLKGTRITHLPSSIGNLSQLSFLDLSRCHELSFVPEEICHLKSIRFLDLTYCHKLQFLPELPRSLKYLDARGCSSLKAVSSSLSILLATSKKIYFSGCYMLDEDKFTTIIQEALLEIQRRFRERPAQAIEEDEDENKLSFVEYSGCEIPKFFEFQCSGSMISMELPYETVGGKIVGLAFFVVHRPCGPIDPLGWVWTGPLDIKFHCKTTFENSECSLIRNEFIPVSGQIPKKAAEDDSGVVIVGYTSASYHRNFPSQYQSILLELKFSLFCCEVEKCGFRLFSVPVSEERKGTSSSSSEEKQLETSPKGLKILLHPPFS